MKRLDLYLIRRLLGPGLYGLLIFSTLWLVQLLMKMIDLLVTKDVPLWAVSKIFAYSLPVVFTTSAPMASLLAILMAIGTLSADSELTAMKASGIGFHRIAFPMIAVGCLVSLAVLGVSELVVPRASNERNRVYLNEVVLKKPFPKVTQNIFFDGGKEFKVFVRQFDYQSNTIKDVSVFQLDATGFPRITEARSARLSDKRWVFKDGSTSTTDPDGRVTGVIHFDTWDYPLDLRYGPDIKDVKPRPGEMSLPDLYMEIREYESRGLPVMEHWIEFWWKTAFPFASMVLMFLAAPLAASSGRSGPGLGVGLSILIMFLYYVLLAVGKTLGESGYLTPFLASWSPNLVVMAFSVWLMRRAGT